MKLHDLNAHATQLFPYLLRPKSPHTGNTWRGDKFNSEHDAVTLFFEKVPVVGRRDGRPCPARGANGERRWRGQYSTVCREPRTEICQPAGVAKVAVQLDSTRGKACTRTQDDHWSPAPERGNWRGTMTTCNLPVLSRSVTEVIIIVLTSVIHLIILPSPPSHVPP